MKRCNGKWLKYRAILKPNCFSGAFRKNPARFLNRFLTNAFWLNVFPQPPESAHPKFFIIRVAMKNSNITREHYPRFEDCGKHRQHDFENRQAISQPTFRLSRCSFFTLFSLF